MNACKNAPSHVIGVILAAIILVAFTSGAHGATDKMPWLREALQITPGPLATDADAVVLLDYTHTIVAHDGLFTTETRKAVQILTVNGADAGVINIDINKDDKITNLHARLILPGDKIRDYSMKHFVRAEAHDENTVFTERHTLHLDLSTVAVPGSVVACSFTVCRRKPVLQFSLYFHVKYPVANSIFHLRTPTGWTIRTTPVNGPDYRETTAGDTHTWEASNVPPVPLEDFQDIAAKDIYLGITLLPSSADRAKCRTTTIDDWNSVATYAASKTDPAAVPDEAIRKHVAKLTQSCTTPWERIKALCTYVQDVNYISVAMKLNTGGGFCPAPASTVFARNSGDCKDKTALLRAMLSCIGVQSYSIVCSVGADRVDPEWPSPNQFNHNIVAIVAPENLTTAADLDDPGLGRLILFDPTDEDTPPGFLSEYIQNHQVLICSDKAQGLSLAPSGVHFVRITDELSFDAGGSVSGVLECVSFGSNADYVRSMRRKASEKAFRMAIYRELSRQTPTATIKNVIVQDDQERNEVKTTIHFDASGFARRIGKDRLLFRTFVDHGLFVSMPSFSSKERETPVILSDYEQFRDITIKIPEGYLVEELPLDTRAEEPFGSIVLHASEENDVVRLHLEYRTERKTIPPSDYEKVRSFFATLNKTLQSTIVIRRK